MSQSPRKLSKEDEQLLAEALAYVYPDEGEAALESSDAPPPPPGAAAAKAAVWYPDLNPTQDLIFNDPAPHILGYGEKGTGKSIGFGHKLVRHAYENDALVLIISPSMRTGNEGIWYDLDTLILPQWKEGMGLEYTSSKLDPYTKDRHRWIKNRHGRWSKLLLMSIPYATMVADRVKGPAPSMVYIDELTNCNGVEYFKFTVAQMGRRRGIEGPQQWMASCNPEGPSHWVYQTFFVDHVDEKGVRDPDFSVYHVPIAENKSRLPPGYVERLEKVLKTDPIEFKRLVLGEWIDRPTGDGLFKEFFIPSLHTKGDAKAGLGLIPIAGFPIIIGYDLGQVWNCATLMQCIPTKDPKKPTIWTVFDEVHHLNKRIVYRRMAWEIIERVRHWRKLCDYQFQVMHIADESAVNQWRPGGEGSYDAWDFEKEYARVAADLGERSIRMIGCAKGAGSVAARIRALQGKLFQEEIFISATCLNTIEMLNFLEAEDKDPEKPRRSKYLHVFDSLTYPILKLELKGGPKNFLPSARTAPTLVRCGVTP